MTKHREGPIPESLSSRAVPLFVFLKDEAMSEKVAVEGLLEWTDYWAKQGTRVRALSKEMEIAKTEVRLPNREFSCVEQTLNHRFGEQLVRSCRDSHLSSETTKAKISSINDIFSSEAITTRIPPHLHRIPPLLTDDQISKLDETSVIDCLVRINAQLTTTAVYGMEKDEQRDECIAGKRNNKRHSLQRFTSFRKHDEHAPPSEIAESHASSPKARRVLGMDKATSSSKGKVPQGSTGPSREYLHKTQLSTTHLFQTRSPSHNTLLYAANGRETQPDIQRSNSLSGARSLLATLIGTDQRQPTPSAKSGRTEKYLRGVVDLFRHKSSQEPPRPDPKHPPTERHHTRSVPARGKLAATPSKPRGSVDNALSYSSRKDRDKDRLASRNMNGDTGTGTFMSVRLPTLFTGFRLSIDGKKDTKGVPTLPSSVVEEQILEVLLEYINKELSPTCIQTESAGSDGARNDRLLALIQSLNHISFDTRFKVRRHFVFPVTSIG
jgi:hypothetical protein